MKTRTKKWILSGGMLSLMLFMAGCIRIDESGNPAGSISQFLYDYLVLPTQQFIEFLNGIFGSYGLAIIAITIIVRILILPLSIRQQRATMEQQVKMSVVKPAADEIQAEMKEATDPKQKQELQAELMSLYRENNVNMLGGLGGCLPLLIQMPVFTAMFQAIRMSESIQNASFLGIGLGERSILLALATGAVYYLQSRVMLLGMPEDQRKQSNTMMLMSPIMLLFISFSSPAGLTLYWLVGGFVAIAQSAITTFYYKPKVQAELKEKHGEVQVVERKRKPRKEAEKVVNSDQTTSASNRNKRNASPFESKSKRNEGKQKR
ncbi:membrane protein insertase YidC [Marinilactibacillus psychrotolerans]|uniref:Membrane protein insertase YidC n=2 Tax=Marinilactibacillus psychrotolerans TaxID=191770 RepID=A0ABW8UGP4_9LACT|nr:membrane protein insertase YidC [Marinilactibacillus psychrotolerans]SJN18546.1 Inner membrane protein translocase component YidC, OxaA protein [Marinilactibacillus psychrotolerans 42ea]